MDIVLNAVQIIDPKSPLNGQKKNILISNGIIKRISDKPIEAEKLIEGDDMYLTPGWFDMWSFIGDPGLEHKEDLESGTNSAAAGGFTEIALLPNTIPTVQNKNLINYLKNKSKFFLTQVYPYGAITQDTEGKDITEMIDMHTAGAVAFTDGIKPVWNTDILLKSLLYSKKFDGLIIQKPEDKWLNMFGTMNEGVNSTLLGMKGMPAISEEITIERDLRLLEYSDARIHFANISTAKSVELIKMAKQSGLKVSCDVAAYQLYFDDEYLSTFDANFKVNPPLRTKKDIDALIQGLKDDTIDAIVSSHIPQDEESKKLEFDLAEFGAIGFQTVLPVINHLMDKVSLDKLISKLVYSSRQLLKIPVPEIKQGELANLTLFDPNKEWIYNSKSNKSKSNNTPFWDKHLKGKVIGVFNNNQVVLDEGF